MSTDDMYWVLSIIDFYQYTGDKSVGHLLPHQLTYRDDY